MSDASDAGNGSDVDDANNTNNATDADHVHDVIGVGLGPFNLGLAALVDGSDDFDLDTVFLEQKQRFSWHEGMLLRGTTLEVPFLADLVTLADPTNPYSYLNYLRAQGRIYEFYFYETMQTPRREFDDYCRWVAERVTNTRFAQRVVDVEPVEDAEANFRVVAEHPETGEPSAYLTRDLVVGVGSRPYVPEAFQGFPDDEVFHTAGYRSVRDSVLDADSVTVVGSGQSAAEVFQDLLERQPDEGYRLDWVTRSEGFFPMEYSKLGLQHFTPEYVDYVFDLPQPLKDEFIPEQDLLYKGIDPETSNEIYDALYEQSIGHRAPDIGMIAMTEVDDIVRTETGRYRLDCHQWQEETDFSFESDVVILGTGYYRPMPSFLTTLENGIARDDHGRLKVNREYDLETDFDGTVFVQNAEVHTHGVGAPDLGLGTYRNAIILDQLLAESPYPVDRDTVYQDFSPAAFVRDRPAGRAASTGTDERAELPANQPPIDD